MKKYAFTKERMTLLDGTVVRRIKALRDFGYVKKGDIGGWIEHEANLSHDGNCWVYGNAKVTDEAEVYGEAEIHDDARVYDKAKVYGEARVYGKAWVYGRACVYDIAEIYDAAKIYDDARVCYRSNVSGNAEICGNAVVKDLSDYMVFNNTWSSGRWFTYTASNKMWKAGCFYGTGKELIAKAKKDSELSGKCYKLIVKATEALEKANAGK